MNHWLLKLRNWVNGLLEKIKRLLFKAKEFLINYKVVILGLILLIVFLIFYYHSEMREISVEANAEVLSDYQKQLEKNPYDGNLLLRAARHHYYVVRNRLKEKGNKAGVRELLVKGLSLYRRLGTKEEWQLQPRDYFINAYLYYKLGTPYLSRAREMALKSYRAGERSAELMALLANIHYSLGKYKVALKYFNVLGTEFRDPVLIFNKARCLWALGETSKIQRARQLLQKGLRLVHSNQYENGGIEKNYQLALARVELDLKNYRRAREIIKEYSQWRDDTEFMTLFAEILVAQGNKEKARKVLESVLSRREPPVQAELLLKRIDHSEEN